MNKIYVLVIGASSAIGCEIIRQISGGHTVIFAHYRQGKDRIEELHSEVTSTIIPIQADLSHQNDIDVLIETVASTCNVLQQIIFIAAPSLVLTRFKELKWTDFKAQIDVQLFSAFEILNRFLPEMSKAKYGKVIFVLTSYTIGKPPSAMAHYVTAKYALLGFMKALSSEYAGKNICINAVSPSMIETNFLEQIPEKLVEFSAQQHPLKRNGIPGDIAPVVKFLLSEGSDFITGVNIPVTGGG